MASISARMVVTHSTSWADFRAEAERLGIPDDAKLSLHVDKGYGPTDPGIDEVVFTWSR